MLNLYFLVPIVSGAGDAQSLLSRVVCLLIIVSFCTCYFGHCVVCPSFIYGFWLLPWYLQTPLFKYFVLLYCV
jgi:hypothetical protein